MECVGDQGVEEDISAQERGGNREVDNTA